MVPVSTPPLSPEQEALFRLIEDTDQHVFVTGRAGTGKSTLLQHLAWNTEKQIAVCAPTGVAAGRTLPAGCCQKRQDRCQALETGPMAYTSESKGPTWFRRG